MIAKKGVNRGVTMFKIAICDDEDTSLRLNKALTEKVLDEINVEYEISTFQDMREMTETLTKLTVAQPFNVLLCDILTTDMNGIEAAEKLRQLGEQLDIIFISSTADFALDGYRVQALRYIQKPVDIDKLREALMLSYHKYSCKEGIAISVEGKSVNVAFEDIAYIESCGRDIDIHVGDKILTTHIKISDMEKMLPQKDFFRCHRSYIVNFNYMDSIERYQVTMKAGDYIPVSQQLYAETKNRYLKYR